LARLTLLWQQGGPPQVNPGTYWPAIDPATNELWVASSSDNRYWIFDQDGTYRCSWGNPGSGDGQLNLLSHTPTPEQVGAIAFAPDGTFYVADNGNYRIQKFDPSGNFVLKWGTFGNGDGQFVSPKGIFVHGDMVTVEDDARHDLQEFDTSGTFLREIPGFSPLMAMDRSGNFWAHADDNSPNVVEVSPSGKQLQEFSVSTIVVDDGSLGETAVDLHGNIFEWIAFRNDPENSYGLIELNRHGVLVNEWGEPFDIETDTLSLDGKAIYLACTDPAWPYVRKYALP
jgi:DNA-binding beta-propeller fold protein YncE